MSKHQVSAADLFRRYHNADYSENIIYEGETGASLLREENKSDNIHYDRPVFNCPDINGPGGNVFSLLNHFESCMRQNKYDHEYAEFSRDGFDKFNYTDLINRMALFVDMENVVKVVEVDGEVFKKIIKTPENIQNLPEFKVNSIAKFNQIIKNGFDITTTNTYGRNIMHYISDPALLQHVVDYNEKLATEGKDHIRYVSLDNFNATLLSNRTNFKSFNIIFEAMYKEVKETFGEDSDMMNTLVFGRDVFNNNSISTMSHNFEEVFSSLSNMKNQLKDMIETLSMISSVDSQYAQSVMNTIKDEKFIKSLDKKFHGNSPETIRKMVEESAIQYQHEMLDKKLQVKTNEIKKIKI